MQTFKKKTIKLVKTATFKKTICKNYARNRELDYY